MLTKFIQVNANRSQVVLDLLQATANKESCDVLIVSEPNRRVVKNGTWVLDEDGDAALKLLRGAPPVRNKGHGRGFVWVECMHWVVCSCYFSPNSTTRDFEEALEKLADFRRTSLKGMIIAGDFNAKAVEWGSPITDRRGQLVADWAAANELVVINQGNRPTFARGSSKSIIDLTFMTENMARFANSWRVRDEETLSDHKYISFELGIGPATTQHIPGTRRWKLGPLDMLKLEEPLRRHFEAHKGITAANLAKVISAVCEEVLKPNRQGCKRPTYWWNAEIARLRKISVKIRRKITRARTRWGPLAQIVTSLSMEHNEARKALRTEIIISKKRKWQELCDLLDEDPWSDAYKIVTKKLGKSLKPLDTDLEWQCARELFPDHPQVKYEEIAAVDIPLFTLAELEKACNKLKNNRSPGLDGIPAEVVKEVAKAQPEIVLKVINDALLSEEFPKEWKVAKLVLIPKEGKPEGHPSSYRPLCLLSALGKMFEQLILTRLQEELTEKQVLSDRQFGFRAGRSTVDAIKAVVEKAVCAAERKRSTREIPAVILLDVRNAFNSASWKEILLQLKRLDISPYLRRIIQAYLRERAIKLGSGGQEVNVTSGVPQGSVLGPTLWNILYDGVLRIKFQQGVSVYGYADDLALVVTAKNEASLMIRANDAMDKINQWLEAKGLNLAPEKTEAVVMAGRRKLRPIQFQIEGISVRPKDKIKYLGVWLDRWRSFIPHVKEAASKAVKVTNAISGIMRNVGGPKESKRRIMASAVMSIALYGAPVWAGALGFAGAKKALLRVQRRAALRITCAYRTVSQEAVLIIARTPPIHLLALERQQIHEGEDRVTARQAVMTAWQAEWDTSTKGAWTRRLIPLMAEWVEREYGEVNFYLTQVLTGHGCFNQYLERFKRKNTRNCNYCGEPDDVEHTVFRCPRWGGDRDACWAITGTQTPDTLVSTMLEREAAWNAISRMAQAILQAKTTEQA